MMMAGSGATATMVTRPGATASAEASGDGRTIAVGNIVVARSGNTNGNLAIASNPVFIGNGLWSWPTHADNDDWFWRDRINVGNITVAGRGNGNVAIASNPVFI